MAELMMQDATPLAISSVHTSGSQGLKVIRRGKQPREWLLERVLFVDAHGEKCLLFGEIRHMKDKTASAHHASGTELWRGARVLGHMGPLITHGCWGRAVQSACARLQAQRAAAWREHHCSQDPVRGQECWLWHWVTSVGCSAHDFTNALRWANLEPFGNRNCMRRLWISIEALRSSLDQLVRQLPSWLGQHLRFRNHAYEAFDHRAFWAALGIKGDWLDEFVLLEIRFVAGELLVSARFEGDPAIPQRVANCYMYLFSFRAWSDTRWCGVGNVCRRVVAASVLGLSPLVLHVLDSPGESSYYLSGFSNMTPAIMRTAIICALTAGVSETGLGMVLKDNRLARILPALTAAVAAERDLVLDFPLGAYEVLSGLCDSSGSSLASQCSMSVIVQLGYAEHRLRVARGLPWCLVCDDIESRLRAFKDDAAPMEETSLKTHTLLNIPVPVEAVAKSVYLLGEMPFASTIAEQAHVLSAQLMH